MNHAPPPNYREDATTMFGIYARMPHSPVYSQIFSPSLFPQAALTEASHSLHDLLNGQAHLASADIQVGLEAIDRSTNI